MQMQIILIYTRKEIPICPLLSSGFAAWRSEFVLNFSSRRLQILQTHGVGAISLPGRFGWIAGGKEALPALAAPAMALHYKIVQPTGQAIRA